MNSFEDPINFEKKRKIENTEISYHELTEISQGGPEVGKVSINGIMIEGFLFGGPLISKNEFIYLPVYVKKFLDSSFKLAKINIENLTVKIFGKSRDLIFIDHINDNKIYFYEDINKTIGNSFDLSNV